MSLHPNQARIPPKQRGIPLKKWIEQCREEQFEQGLEFFRALYPDGPPLSKKAIAGKRDSYGRKSA